MKDMQETWVRFLGWEESLEKGVVTHSSILASDMAGTEMPYGLQSWGHKELEHSYTHTHTHTHSLSVCILYWKKCKHMAYTYMFRHLCMHICVYMCVHLYICISPHIYICMFEWMCVFWVQSKRFYTLWLWLCYIKTANLLNSLKLSKLIYIKAWSYWKP